MIPQHVQHVLLSVIVVKERRIETAAVEIHRIRPFAVDVGARDQVVVEVPERCTRSTADGRAPVSFHVGVHEIEAAVGICEIRGPHAARIRIAEHVQLSRPSERPAEQPPIREIARVVDLDAWKPFERGRRDVVIVADADDRRIRIEAAKNGIADH